MRGVKHPDELKAQVIASLLAGASVGETATSLSIPKQTVSEYKTQIPEDVLSQIRSKKGERLDDLVYQCLIGNLETLYDQAMVAREPDYIRKQPAGELATLYGVMADKTIRLLAATTNPANLPRQLEDGAAT